MYFNSFVSSLSVHILPELCHLQIFYIFFLERGVMLPWARVLNIWMYLWTCTYIYICVCLCVCVYTHICLGTYIYIYTHIERERERANIFFTSLLLKMCSSLGKKKFGKFSMHFFFFVYKIWDSIIRITL